MPRGVRSTQLTRPVARSSLWATWSTVGQTRRGSCGWSWEWRPRGTPLPSRGTTRTSWCEHCRAARCASATVWRRLWPNSTLRRTNSERACVVGATAWSHTSSSMMGDWSSRMRGCPSATTGGPPAECERSPCTATPPARPTTSGCLCAIRGRSTIGGGPPCSMATRRRSRPNGSTGRCAWTPVACSADTSPRCVGPSVRLFRFPPSGSGTNPAVPSRRPIPTLCRAPRRGSTRREAGRISISRTSSDVESSRPVITGGSPCGTMLPPERWR
ncbi:MAG: hypothetical protein BWY91_02657 [bacterium ADurb.BinA028]|nr:MAG: hypothetical protein BWY91_02657 [bacterium ADurb.BinA028]